MFVQSNTRMFINIFITISLFVMPPIIGSYITAETSIEIFSYLKWVFFGIGLMTLYASFINFISGKKTLTINDKCIELTDYDDSITRLDWSSITESYRKEGFLRLWRVTDGNHEIAINRLEYSRSDTAKIDSLVKQYLSQHKKVY